jgi:hypothetical protein
VRERQLFDTGKRQHGQAVYAEALPNGKVGFELKKQEWLDSTADSRNPLIRFHRSQAAARKALTESEREGREE